MVFVEADTQLLPLPDGVVEMWLPYALFWLVIATLGLVICKLEFILLVLQWKGLLVKN